MDIVGVIYLAGTARSCGLVVRVDQSVERVPDEKAGNISNE